MRRKQKTLDEQYAEAMAGAKHAFARLTDLQIEKERQRRRAEYQALVAGRKAQLEAELADVLDAVALLERQAAERRVAARAVAANAGEVADVDAEIVAREEVIDRLAEERDLLLVKLEPKSEVARVERALDAATEGVEGLTARRAALSARAAERDSLLGEAGQLDAQAAELRERASALRALIERAPGNVAGKLAAERAHEEALLARGAEPERPTAIVMGMPDAAEVAPGLYALRDGSFVNAENGVRFWTS